MRWHKFDVASSKLTHAHTYVAHKWSSGALEICGNETGAKWDNNKRNRG